MGTHLKEKRTLTTSILIVIVRQRKETVDIASKSIKKNKLVKTNDVFLLCWLDEYGPA